jgi:PAS domain S-box-containing protein
MDLSIFMTKSIYNGDARHPAGNWDKSNIRWAGFQLYWCAQLDSHQGRGTGSGNSMFRINHLRDICDAMHDAIVVVDQASLTILYANQAILRLTGFDQTSLSQKRWPELYARSHRAYVADFAMWTNGQKVYFEAPLVSSDNAAILTETQITNRQIDGQPCLICVIRDIRHRPAIEQELRRRETLYRSLVEAMPDLLFRIRRDGTYLESKVPDNLGLRVPTDEEIIGKKIADIVPEHVTEIAMPAIGRVLDTGQMETIEYAIEEPSGLHEYEARFVASFDDEVIALVRDITDRKRNETLLHIQRDLSVVLSVETKLDRALRLVIETAVQVAGMDCGGIYLVDPVSGAQEMMCYLGLSDEFAQAVSRFDADTPQTNWLMGGKPVYAEYFGSGADLTDIQKRENLRAVALNPVLYRNQVIAGLLVASHTTNQIPAPARDALETIASHIGSAIVRIRAEEARRESEETTRALLNASRDMAMLLDRNSTILAANEPVARQLGSTVDALLNTCILDYLPSEVALFRKARLEEVFRTGRPELFQDVRQGRYFDHAVHPLFNARNEVTRVAVFVRDITEQKRAEEALLQKDRLLEGIAKATSHLMTTGDQEVVFDEALTLLGHAANIDRVFIFENHPHPETGEPVASYRFGWADARAPRKTALSALRNLPWQAAGLQYWYDALVAGQEIRASHQDLANIHLSGVSTDRITSLLIVPVFINGSCWGGIGFDNLNSEHEWSGDEISALRTMATGVGAAIERQQAEAQLLHEREIADTLREVGMVLASSLELGKVLGQILEQARRVVPYDAANVFLLEDGVARLVHHHGYEAFGLTKDYMNQIRIDPEKAPLVEKILRDGKPYLCSDTHADPGWRDFPGLEWVQSWLGAPIVVRGKVGGIFSFDAVQKNFYGEEHVRQIAPLARQAAIAIENALLFEDTQRLERIKSEMIRMASHDLRSPLTRIKETLRRVKELPADSDPVDRDKHCTILEEAAQEMEQIIVSILSLEQIEARHRSARSIIWCELLAESVVTIRVELEAKRHRLSVECEPDLPITRGDPVQLQRAMINLIGNAIKYTPPGGHIRVHVYRSSYGGTPTIAFEVQDNGIGIPLELQEQLFQPFYRAEQTGTEDIDGLGLGLSIVKAAITYHKGNVYVDSDPGQGSLFGFWVPI